MKYEAKKDLWLSILIWAAIILPIFLLIIRGDVPVLGMIIFSLPSALLIWVWFGTGYEIDDDILKYSIGPFKGEIFIDDINRIVLKPRESYNAGGLSTDRMTIIHQKTKQVTIAPLNKMKLIEDLKKIKSSIEIVE